MQLPGSALATMVLLPLGHPAVGPVKYWFAKQLEAVVHVSQVFVTVLKKLPLEAHCIGWQLRSTAPVPPVLQVPDAAFASYCPAEQDGEHVVHAGTVAVAAQ